MNKKTYPLFTVRLPEALLERLTQLSARTGRPKAYYVKQGLETYLDAMESVYHTEQNALDAAQADYYERITP